jgi:hypothetical protein
MSKRRRITDLALSPEYEIEFVCEGRACVVRKHYVIGGIIISPLLAGSWDTQDEAAQAARDDANQFREEPIEPVIRYAE